MYFNFRMGIFFIFVLIVFTKATSEKGSVVPDFYWRFYKGVLPDDAIKVATGIYIGNVISYGRLPATILHLTGVATIGINEKQINFNDNILIMCSARPSRFYWEYVDFNTVSEEQMKDAVVGGYFNEIAGNVYIGKSEHRGEWRVGRVIANDHHLKGLWIWNNEKISFCSPEFFILKYNNTGLTC